MSSNTSRPDKVQLTNDFREGTTSHKIAERLLRGESDAAIQKALKLKPQPIYNIRSRMRQRAQKKQEKTAVRRADTRVVERPDPPMEDDGESAKPVTAGGNGGKRTLPVLAGNGGETPLTPQLGGDGGKTMPLGLPLRPGEAVIAVSGIAPGRTIQINPKILTMHQWLCASTDYDGDIGDFLNDTAEYFFRVNNYVMKIVKEEIIE